MQRNAAAVRWRYRLYRFAKRGLLPLLVVFLAAGAIVLNGFHLRLNPEGDSQLTLKFGENYKESGVTAYLAGKYFLKDGIAVDARISSSGCVDPLMAGSYSLSYEAEWLFFRASASRTVTVLEGHDPVITLDIIEGHYTLPGREYTEEGYRAFDEEDGDLTDLVTREEKDGCVYYTVTDSHGNQACVERDIFYCDPEPPVITLEGDQEMSVYLDAKYSEPGYTAMDNADGDLTDQVQVKGKVKTSKTGTYTITYTLKDAYGNEASAERIVHVVKRTVPDTVMPEGKTIYLTFDDGPGPYTEKLLDILEKYDVKATFFVVDTKYLHLLPRMVEDGHAIGIHSITHDYRDIYASKSAYFQDLEGMQDIIARPYYLDETPQTLDVFRRGVKGEFSK